MEQTYRITFQIYHNQELEFQFEEGAAILFGLNGCSQVLIGTKNHEIERAGLLVINPMEIYQVTCSNNAAVLCLHIDRAVVDNAGWQRTKYCQCYAKDNEKETEEFLLVRQYLAEIFQEYIQNRSVSIDFQSPLMKLLHHLQKYFALEYRALPQREATMQRIKHILDIIHERWNEDISLSEIAEQEYLSVSYLSRFFQKNLNLNFSQYIKRLRLIRAAQKLTQSNESITRISYDCGFKTPSAFIEAFKQQYEQTPGQFREAKKLLWKSQATGLPQSNLRSDVSALLDYEPEKKEEDLPEQTYQIFISSADEPIWKGKGRRMLNIGYAREGLLAPVQQQIVRAQKEIGFDFVRFHGLFDEDMKIYQEDMQGNPVFYFAYVDLLFDFLLEQHLTPYVELSFMPALLAREQTKIFDRPSIISGCTDLRKWRELIRETLLHFVERYGIQEIRTWRFTTISQSNVHLGCVQWKDYQDLYLAAYETIKGIDRHFKFGGPGCFPELIHDEEIGVPAFLKFVCEKQCIPDFIAIQCYPHVQTYDPLFMNYTLSQQSSPAILSEDKDFVAHAIQELKELLNSFQLKEKELFLEECTSTLWQRDLSSETCYKAVWMAKNVCDSMTDAVFGYWLLTDFIEERAAMESVFHGGYGLFTYNGIPKAGYQAMCLLGMLGSCVIQRGDSWIVTQEGNSWRILVYNYCHYSNIYRYRYQRLEQPQDAYCVFESGSRMHAQFVVHDIPDGMYQVEYRSITREQGSAFDKWVQMGASRYLKKQELEYLNATAGASYEIKTVQATDGLHLDVQLQPLEVMFLQFSLPNADG